MRAVIMSHQYHPQIGGAERVTRAIAEAVANSGWEAHVFTSGEQSDVEQMNGVIVHRFNVAGNFAKGIRGDTEEIRARLARLKPEVIIIYALQTWGSDIFLGNAAIPRNGSAIILIPCGLSALSTLTRRIFYRGYLRRLRRNWRRFDHYVFHTKHGNDYRFLGDLVGDRCTIVPNFFPHDMLTWSPTAADRYLQDHGLGHLTQQPFVLNVSNHYRIKGHATLMRKFLKSFPDSWQLVIAGSEPHDGRGCAAQCKRKSARSDRITLLDGSDRKLVLSLYHRASLFFLTSQIEYFPLVLLEAQAVGLPFLSFPVGNAHELLGGIVVRPRDVTPGFIRNLLQQPAVLKDLGARGQRQSLAEHSESRIQEQYVRLIRRILGTCE
jgi:glycosyltransferase involved in cell wall biosynthesis